MDNMVEPALHYNLWIDLIFNPVCHFCHWGLGFKPKQKGAVQVCCEESHSYSEVASLRGERQVRSLNLLEE